MKKQVWVLEARLPAAGWIKIGEYKSIAEVESAMDSLAGKYSEMSFHKKA